jgi:flavin-dependent dehydrogenase
VCIVGAGPAGLTAANQLESKGYETVIFEKQPEVGGKSQAYYQE